MQDWSKLEELVKSVAMQYPQFCLTRGRKVCILIIINNSLSHVITKFIAQPNGRVAVLCGVVPTGPIWVFGALLLSTQITYNSRYLPLIMSKNKINLLVIRIQMGP